MSQIKKFLFSLFTIAIMMICLIGIYGIVTAPKEKERPDQKQLQAELVRNRKQLNKFNAENKNVNSGVNPHDEVINTNTQPTPDKEHRPAPNSKPNNETENNSIINQDNITAIGDSVMLGAAPAIQNKFPNCIIDAKESRQLTDCFDIVQNLNSEGKLYNKVIIALGTNGDFNKSDGQKLLDYLGKDRQVYWITTYGKTLTWQNNVNDTIKKLAESNSNVTIIDWSSVIRSKPNWLYSDGIHLNSDGQARYANYLSKEIV